MASKFKVGDQVQFVREIEDSHECCGTQWCKSAKISIGDTVTVEQVSGVDVLVNGYYVSQEAFELAESSNVLPFDNGKTGPHVVEYSGDTALTKPTNPKDRAATNRLDLSLFPETARAYGALAMTEGDCKYGGYNYRVAGVATSTYVAALGRHIAKYYNGEWADTKTKVPHLANAIACIAVLIDAHEANVLVDDRPPVVDMAALLSRFEGIVQHLHIEFPNGPDRYTHNSVRQS